MAATKAVPKPLPIDQLLSKLLDSIKPIDFKSFIFPDSIQIAERLEALKPSMVNPVDGSLIDGDKATTREYFRLQKKLDDLKIIDSKLIVAVIEQINIIANKNKWQLSKFDGSIYVFNGCYHEPVSLEMFHSFLSQAALRLGVDHFKCSYHLFRDNLLSQFLSGNYLNGKKSDDKTVKLNLVNGTLWIANDGKRELKAFAPSDFLKYQLPFSYEMEATAPRWQTFLNEVLPDESKRLVLAEFISSIFIPNSILKLEVIAVLYGSGRNGKSVVYEILSSLLGETNISSYSLQNLTDPNNGTYRAGIKDKLLNFSSEISSKLDPNILKALASGERIETKTLYKMPIIMDGYARLMTNANTLPTDVENTTAFFRRWLIIHFDVTIPDNKVDTALPAKIIANELPGVLNWVLAGLDRLMSQNRLTKSAAIDNMADDYRLESDSVLMFLKECNFKRSDTERILQSTLYQRYRNYAQENGHNPVSMKNFKKRIQGAGLEIRRETSGTMVFVSNKKGVNDDF